MSIRMIGIDHNSASIEYRELFSFTKKKSSEAMIKINNTPGILGCVIISTCNRMEIWISCQEDFLYSLYDLLCEIKGLEGQLYSDLFVQRSKGRAVKHLFKLASGLKSMIQGEDQIITQVKEALALSRENYCTDNVLEVLFRMAVTAAKKVKANVVLSSANQSVIHHAVAQLKEQGILLTEKKCMVIGNGEMGKLAAAILHAEGADVTATIRQFRSGIVNIPVGCKRINYGDRMKLFNQCDIIVSATSSPNYTLKKRCVDEVSILHPMILIDLALPRDIEPEIGTIQGIQLYDVDHYHVNVLSEQAEENIRKAELLLQKQMEEFVSWYESKDIIPRILDIKNCAANDLELRMHKIVKKLPMEWEEKEILSKDIEIAVGKTISKLIFGLKDTVSRETFRECMEGLEKFYHTDSEEETGEIS